jgi:hypothetical protein
MSDEQVRQAYTRKLKQETPAQPGSDPTREEENTWVAVSETFYKAADSAAALTAVQVEEEQKKPQ